MRSSLIWNLPDVSDGSQSVLIAAEANPGLPGDGDGPIFQEPWEARAFAMALALQESGLFSWEEWAGALGEEIRKAQAAGDPDTGHSYYSHWLATLERIIAEKGVTTARILARYARAWDYAADRTPHGMPIELRREDFEARHR
jgi:nitrile hydratase accessory protein